MERFTRKRGMKTSREKFVLKIELENQIYTQGINLSRANSQEVNDEKEIFIIFWNAVPVSMYAYRVWK
jgi:hypothetical protein